MTTPVPDLARTRHGGGRRTRLAPWRTALLVPVIAAGADLVVWLVVRAAGVELTVADGDGIHDVGLATVLAGALVPGLLGVLTLQLALRLSPLGLRRWTVAAVTVTVLSLAAPLAQAETRGAAAVLLGLHLLTGAVVVLGLRLVVLVGTGRSRGGLA